MSDDRNSTIDPGPEFGGVQIGRPAACDLPPRLRPRPSVAASAGDEQSAGEHAKSWKALQTAPRAGVCRLRPGHDNRLAGAVSTAGEEGVEVMPTSRAAHVVREVHVIGLGGVPHDLAFLSRLFPAGCS
jgi:hypothetical protein